MTPHQDPTQAAGDDKPAKPDKTDRPSGLAEQLAFKSRFVLVFGEIDDKLARSVCERLILLAQDSDAPINMLISSPGGHVESGDAIHDMIRFVRAPVTTIGTRLGGQCGHAHLPGRRRRSAASACPTRAS